MVKNFQNKFKIRKLCKFNFNENSITWYTLSFNLSITKSPNLSWKCQKNHVTNNFFFLNLEKSSFSVIFDYQSCDHLLIFLRLLKLTLKIELMVKFFYYFLFIILKCQKPIWSQCIIYYWYWFDFLCLDLYLFVSFANQNYFFEQ